MINRLNKTEKKFKGGGYFKSEEVEPGITVLEMDGKGFAKMFLPKKANLTERKTRE